MKIKSLETLAAEHAKKERISQLNSEVAEFASVREDVFNQMLERGKPEYKWFILGIRILRRLSGSFERSHLMENYYIAMRFVDDVADGDVPLPDGYASSADYVQQKIDNLTARGLPKDKVDELFKLCFKLAKEAGFDISEETVDILESLLFDAKRKGTHQIFSGQELYDHFYKLDIRGVIGGALKACGESPEHFSAIQPLGEADRIYYNLRDLKEDLKAGLVNISAEDCERLDITIDTLKSRKYKNHPGVLQWCKEQAKKGLTLFLKTNMKNGNKPRPPND